MYPLLLMSSVAVILDQHIKKSLQTLNGLGGLHYFCLGVTEQPTKAPFFYLVGCAAKFIDEKRADELWGISQVHRLCVLASGTSAFVIFSCFAFINVCLWHLGQNKGKFFNSVSSRICTLVLLPQIGHSINFSFCIRHISSDSQTQDCLSYCCQGKPQVPFALLLGLWHYMWKKVLHLFQSKS